MRESLVGVLVEVYPTGVVGGASWSIRGIKKQLERMNGHNGEACEKGGTVKLRFYNGLIDRWFSAIRRSVFIDIPY